MCADVMRDSCLQVLLIVGANDVGMAWVCVRLRNALTHHPSGPDPLALQSFFHFSLHPCGPACVSVLITIK